MDSGRLESEPTASVCRRLAAESRTGCLRITASDPDGPDLEAHMYLREGRVYTAAAPGRATRLGDRLVEGGHLSQADLDRALDLQRGRPPGTRLGDVLVTSGILTRAQLRSMVRDQVVDAVAVPLGWTSGRWTFADGEAVHQDIPLGLGMQDTLIEAARREQRAEIIMAGVGSMDAVVDFATGGPEAKLSLKPDEWVMLTHIDGAHSLADIARVTGRTELDVARVVHGLLAAGVVVGAAHDVPMGPPPMAEEGGADGDGVPADAAGVPDASGAADRAARDPDAARDADAASDGDAAPGPAPDDDYLDRLEGLARAGAAAWRGAPPPELPPSSAAGEGGSTPAPPGTSPPAPSAPAGDAPRPPRGLRRFRRG